jgi:hypothetical protein
MEKKKDTFCFSLGTQESDLNSADNDESQLILILMQN